MNAAARGKEKVFETTADDNEGFSGPSKSNVGGSKSENIDVTTINPKKAFETFAGKVFDPAEYYESGPAAEHKFETPLQKYRRLRSEIQEFQKELGDLARNASSGREDITQELTQQLSSDIAQMWGNLEKEKDRPELGKYFKGGVGVGSSEQELIRQLQQFTDPAALSASELGGASTSSKTSATYKLYVKSGQRESAAPRLMELDKRIAYLERLLGRPNEDMPFPDILTALGFLRGRLELVSEDMKLDSIHRKVQQINQEFRKLTESKLTNTRDLENIFTKKNTSKIDKMFDQMKKWDRAIDLLPLTVQRLKIAKNMHEDCADIAGRVRALEGQQTTIEDTLETDKRLLSEAQQSLSTNAQQMMANIQHLQKRMEQLGQRLG